MDDAGNLDVYKALGDYMAYWTTPKCKQAKLANLFSTKKKKGEQGSKHLQGNSF